ncbi:MAG: YfbR-like 5'-deoxynucleotidase [Candidatus Gracilibacteria bacterium]
MIGTILKLMLTSGISMKRWNNFPRIEDISHLDNVGFTLHIAMFLSYLEEKNDNKVDKEFIIKKIIFNSIKILVLSDINSGTRNYIEKVDKDIFSQLEQKAYDYVFSFGIEDYFKEDILKVINNKEKTLELSIILAARRYSSYKECLVNRKVFEEMYEIPYKEIMSSLDQMRKELTSLDMLLKNPNYEKYLSNIRKLSHSLRWNQQKRMFPISVMSHLVLTTFLSYVIGMIENNKGGNLSIFEMMFKALYHDIPEAITGDIITPTKKAVQGFEAILEEVERDMLEDYLFYYVGDEYEQFIKGYMLNPWTGKEGAYVKSADVISALFEAKIEVNYGSTNFIEIYRNIKRIVNTYDYTSIEYILKHVADSFDNCEDDIHL